MTKILFGIVNSWLFATSVIAISTYFVATGLEDTPADREKAARIASRISARGTISEYKPKNRHSSVIKKKTKVKVKAVKADKPVKAPVYVLNPLYQPFMNALDKLTEEVAEIAKDGEVALEGGFSLVKKDGKPVLKFPGEYTKVRIGGVAMGDVLKNGSFSVRRKGADGTDQCKVDEICLGACKRLDEPDFYCTRVTYSAIPSTRQVDSIRMHGNLYVRNTGNAYAMVDEIAYWMKKDYAASEIDVPIPAGTVAFKKLKIGEGMDVVVEVKWDRRKTADGTDAFINITFTVGELIEDGRLERQELGMKVEEARVNTLNKTGVNYFTLRQMVDAEAVRRKTVY